MTLHLSKIVPFFVASIFSLFTAQCITAQATNLESQKSIIPIGNIDQNKVLTVKPGFTRVRIADNLFVDVKGVYPEGKRPIWKFPYEERFEEMSMIRFADEHPHSAKVESRFEISEYNGKAVILSGNGCGDIVVVDDYAVITKVPQTFKIQNISDFKRSGWSDHTVYKDNNKPYGSEGLLTISCDDNGNLVVDIIQEGSGNAPFNPSHISYRIFLKNYTVRNTYSAQKATEDFAQAMAARRESYNKVKSLQASFKSAAGCFVKAEQQRTVERTTTTRELKEFEDGVDANGNVNHEYHNVPRQQKSYSTATYVSTKNICKLKAIIKGITKLADAEGNIYYEDASISLDPGEWTEGEIKLEDTYNDGNAQIKSTHYYTNPLPLMK